MWMGDKMKLIQKAREAVANYDSIGGHGFVDIQDILSVILGPFVDQKIVHNLRCYGLSELKNMSIEEMEAEGLTHNQALTLHASILFGKRCNTEGRNNRFIIRSPKDAADYLMEEMRSLNQENFVALLLDTKNQVIHKMTIFIGSVNASIVHPRETFKEAIKRSAASIVVAHNHPSGNPKPSEEDIHVTRRLVETGKITGIEVLDHLIIGDRKFISLKEEGYIK